MPKKTFITHLFINEKMCFFFNQNQKTVYRNLYLAHFYARGKLYYTAQFCLMEWVYSFYMSFYIFFSSITKNPVLFLLVLQRKKQGFI
ncbi:hypothetical protein C4A75_21320 [Brevibacillus laterosporus]|nr:hypothetical protein C4A75_21320 [Brevibacillus laterosporus]